MSITFMQDACLVLMRCADVHQEFVSLLVESVDFICSHVYCVVDQRYVLYK